MPESDEEHSDAELQLYRLAFHQIPFLEVARFAATRTFLRDRLGEPHFVETDGLRTPSGGEQDWWCFLTRTGQRLGLVLHEPVNICAILADPPDARSALRELSPVVSEPVYVLEQPFSWKDW